MTALLKRAHKALFMDGCHIGDVTAFLLKDVAWAQVRFEEKIRTHLFTRNELACFYHIVCLIHSSEYSKDMGFDPRSVVYVLGETYSFASLKPRRV
ncbi:hypothetical protein NPIL_106811 [Nephila pilipes]|uniref:Uncharacterized protein n=1 Tax=Nephila pilipes TaxID=299642 RepID=A0A8X6PFU9_NEPPI|nr:hypothetical protein NPIL_106811 [Nephila pilipes]